MAFSKMALLGAALAVGAVLAGCKNEEDAVERMIGQANVLDGDTLEIGSIRVRLFGVDAPESSQVCQDSDGEDWACGQASSARLVELIGGSEVACAPVEQDSYGRIIAECMANGRDLGARLVAEGLAWAYVQYSDAHVPAEQYARAQGHGVWRGDAQVAWDYRRSDEWTNASGFAPAGGVTAEAECLIKGNINPNGERIYHMPGTRWYDGTRINENRGQRWFCSEDEALAAGWRASDAQ